MTINIFVLKGDLNGKIVVVRFFFCRVYEWRGYRHFDDITIYPRSGSQMCELDEIVANASKFNLI